MTAILSWGDELKPCLYLWGTMCVRITDNNEYDNTPDVAMDVCLNYFTLFIVRKKRMSVDISCKVGYIK